MALQKIEDLLHKTFQNKQIHTTIAHGDLTLECCDCADLRTVLFTLRDPDLFAFNQLIDLCAVDYLHYGHSDWETTAASCEGFSRAVGEDDSQKGSWDKPRFAVVYHLLSTIYNHRIRVKVFIDEANLTVPSVHDIWKSSLWFEREAYDLFGILFTEHPDLRRILTDYGFIGHPFRKDFPMSGHVEMRYDAHSGKVVYEPVSIEPRITVPRVIRDDNRYLQSEGPKVCD